eukprot:GHVU01110211.1.p1 GENE.GHVU01110211.1~~GHVU01110211.1.p1  ORF type:complete len:338 (+),score=46.10 GHVU01110211.1:93-1106(+)
MQMAVDVIYDSAERPVSSQIETPFLAMVEAVNRDMAGFLGGLGCEKLSPFCRSFRSMREVAGVFLGFWGSRYAKASRHSDLPVPQEVRVVPDSVSRHDQDDEGEKEENEDEDGGIEENVEEGGDRVDALVHLVEKFRQNVDEAGVNEEAPAATNTEAAALPPLCDGSQAVVSDVFNCAAFVDLLRISSPEANADGVLSAATACLMELRAREPGRADSLQKYKSLNGRWFGQRREAADGLAAGPTQRASSRKLRRDDVLLFERRYMRVLSVYVKSYGKLRIVDEADATSDTIVHTAEAVSVQGQIRVNYSILARDRYQLWMGDELADAFVIILGSREV